MCLMQAAALLTALVVAPALPAIAGARTTSIAWLDYEPGLARAAKEGKFVIVEFSTPWCHACKRMDKDAFSDPGVIKKLQAAFIAVHVDADQRRDLSSRFGVFGYPTVFVLDSKGATVCQRAGYMSREEFTALMDYVLTGAYRNTGLMDYLNFRKK